jgi:hypothetical protein
MPETNEEVNQEAQVSANKGRIILFALIILAILGGMVYGIFKLAKSDPETTSHIRDIFIIVLALQSLLIGVALIILVVQMALLTNMLQNEIKPILLSTKDTVATLRGTTAFISNHAVKPVIKASSYLAGASTLLQLLGILGKNKQNKS